MQTVTTIGLDIAKSVFQVHGVDAAGQVVVRRQLKRRYVLAFFEKLPPCLIGVEACASSHHWSRELQALGHKVRLMPPAYVRPYVKRQKNDAADAEAICEAVTRANMRFVETKTPEQQSCLMLHRTRHLFIRQQTAVINAIRAHLAEFGIVAPVGRNGVEELLGVVADASDKRLPEIAAEMTRDRFGFLERHGFVSSSSQRCGQKPPGTHVFRMRCNHCAADRDRLFIPLESSNSAVYRTTHSLPQTDRADSVGCPAPRIATPAPVGRRLLTHIPARRGRAQNPNSTPLIS